jgi:hypothetical protein
MNTLTKPTTPKPPSPSMPKQRRQPQRTTPLKIFFFSTDFLQAILFPAKNADRISSFPVLRYESPEF